MKKKLMLLTLASSLCLAATYAQDVKKIKHGDTFEMYHSADWCTTTTVEGIRIGEYLWIKGSKTNYNMTLGSGGGWSQKIEDEKTIPLSSIEKYLKDNNLKTEELNKFNNGEFQKYYGRHYSPYSFFGNWSYHLQYRRPMDNNTHYSNIDTNERYPNQESPYGWRLPDYGSYRQLFGMCKFNDPVDGRLTGKDIRIDLGAKKGDNPLAFDIASTTGEKSPNWFSTSINRYGFTLMPAGETKDNEKDFTGLFSSVTLPIAYQTTTLMTLSDEGIVYRHAGLMDRDRSISTRSINQDSGGDFIDGDWARSQTRWSTTRMNRRLSPVELGYELFVNYEKENIIKIGVKDDGSYEQNIPKGYTLLAPGYLRGFYCQYFIYTDKYSKNSNYTVSDLIRFEKCVEESGTILDDFKLPKKDCDCIRTYISNHLSLKTSGIGVKNDYSHVIYKDSIFYITAPSSDQGNTNIGLFATSSGGDVSKFICQINNSRDGNIYKCSIPSQPTNSNMYVNNGYYTIQAYIDGDGEEKPIGRILKNEKSSHIIDQLYVLVTDVYNVPKPRIGYNDVDDALKVENTSF